MHIQSNCLRGAIYGLTGRDRTFLRDIGRTLSLTCCFTAPHKRADSPDVLIRAAWMLNGSLPLVDDPITIEGSYQTNLPWLGSGGCFLVRVGGQNPEIEISMGYWDERGRLSYLGDNHIVFRARDGRVETRCYQVYDRAIDLVTDVLLSNGLRKVEGTSRPTFPAPLPKPVVVPVHGSLQEGCSDHRDLLRYC